MSDEHLWTLVEPGQGQTIGSMTMKVRSGQLGGDFSVMQAVVEPYQLLVPHTHQHEDQVVFVIEGQLEFEVGGAGGTRFTAKAGSYVIKPRGISHGFWNNTDKTCHYIELSGREGFEHFVDDTADGAVRAAKAAEAKYDVKFHVTRIPALMHEHGLTSIAGMEMPTEGMAPPPWKRRG